MTDIQKPNKKKLNKVEARQVKNKELILEQLRKTPIVEAVCNKLQINRSTFYRMCASDPAFARDADAALREGITLVCDVAESQLLSAIRNGNLTATIFWLKTHHQQYSDKVELTGRIEHIQRRELTPEERALIEKSLRLALPIHETPPLLPEGSSHITS